MGRGAGVGLRVLWHVPPWPDGRSVASPGGSTASTSQVDAYKLYLVLTNAYKYLVPSCPNELYLVVSKHLLNS